MLFIPFAIGIKCRVDCFVSVSVADFSDALRICIIITNVWASKLFKHPSKQYKDDDCLQQNESTQNMHLSIENVLECFRSVLSAAHQQTRTTILHHTQEIHSE